MIVSSKFAQLRALLQTPANGIITDDWLQVRGSGGSVYVAWPEIAATGKPKLTWILFCHDVSESWSMQPGVI